VVSIRLPILGGVGFRGLNSLVTQTDHSVIEKRPVHGDYAVRKPWSERARAVQPTQGKAIDRARELNPDAGLRVERVRNTKAGSPDKWRKAERRSS
jgi:hypothetical protein